MAGKDKNLLSWREAIKVNGKALKLFYGRYPKMIRARLLITVWQALTPYVGIGISARIIEELAGARNPRTLTGLVLAALSLGAVIALVSALLGRWRAVEDYYGVEEFEAKKMMEMDFCVMDDPKTQQLLSAVRQVRQGNGRGIQSALYNMENLLSAVFTLLGGGALTVTLFTSKVDADSGMAFLNNPLFIAVLVGLMLGMSYLSPALATKAESYYTCNNEMHTMANRLFCHFGFLGGRTDLAADMRIYRQDKMCEKYNKDKCGIFSSRGYFAKLARGPMGAYVSASRAVSGVFSCFVYVYVCLKACMGAYGVGMVTQYIGSITRLSQGFSGLVGALGEMRIGGTFIKQGFSFLEMPNVMYQGSLTVEKRSDRKYEVEFCDVSFRYPGSEQYALRHVDMKFTVGRRLAVVGPNGSGKTTFIKLLCRLYDPTEGVILLNGIDIRKYDYQEYLSVFSVVFQDFTLTDFTLGQTVACRTEYDGARAAAALEKAGFGKRLGELPHGLDTYLSKEFDEEGVHMSGGERQKIALARALYKDAPFIVLDEPTAALDPMAEAEVYGNFNEIIEDKTAIYISHRLSSCKFCDEILVFDCGEIVQQGSHDALVGDMGGKYHELWHAQAQYYGKEKTEEADCACG